MQSPHPRPTSSIPIYSVGWRAVAFVLTLIVFPVMVGCHTVLFLENWGGTVQRVWDQPDSDGGKQRCCSVRCDDGVVRERCGVPDGVEVGTRLVKVAGEYETRMVPSRERQHPRRVHFSLESTFWFVFIQLAVCLFTLGTSGFLNGRVVLDTDSRYLIVRSWSLFGYHTVTRMHRVRAENQCLFERRESTDSDGNSSILFHVAIFSRPSGPSLFDLVCRAHESDARLIAVRVNQFLRSCQATPPPRDEILYATLSKARPGLLASAPKPTALTGMASATMKLRSGGQCQVCGDELNASIHICPSCVTPHHVDCWSYNGGCATFACGGRARLT
jgi:hypothetical protein